jgi:hypothetical protein
MKHTLHILSLLILAGCQTSIKREPEKKDYLTTWLELNEQKVYEELIRKAAADPANRPSNIGTEKAFFESDTSTYLGKFTFQTQRYCDSIQLWYHYSITNDPHAPEFKILLTINYNKNYLQALDTILTSFKSRKHFTVEKYEQPDILPEIYRFQNGDVVVKDIRSEIRNSTPPYDIIFYVSGLKNKKLIKEIDGHLNKYLLGEEILLKKVRHVTFAESDSILNNTLTVVETRKFVNSGN